MHPYACASMSEKITKWVVLTVILLRCIFLAIPDGLTVRPFLFNQSPMVLTSYLWVIAEHAAFLSIVWLWWKDTMKRSAAAFLLICTLDAIDFLLRANTPWFWVAGYPVTNNIFTLICFMLLTHNLDD